VPSPEGWLLRTATSRRRTTAARCASIRRPTATSRSSNDCCKTSASIRRPTTTTPCDWLLQNGHLAVVERLLQDERVDPSADDNYAVRWAAQNGHLAVVDRLLEDDRVDAAVAIQHSRPEHRKRFECRERLTEICIALQDLALPAWITVQILDAARPWSTLPLHSKWNLVCAVKHFHDKHPEQ
jgi:hypothetical protein